MHGQDWQAETTVRPLDRPSVSVLHALAKPDGKTRYVDHMLHTGPLELTATPFAWHRALLTNYDVFHVHWPENLLRASSKARRFIKAILFKLLLAKLQRSSVAVVRTIHNLEPHEKGTRAEEQMVDKLDGLVCLYIRLNSTTQINTDKKVATILHGHYRDRYQSQAKIVRRKKSIIYFGLIRPYKGVSDLIRAFTDLEDPDATLTIMGKPSTLELTREITELSDSDPRIENVLEFVSDTLLASKIREAQLVVLPYREMHNSGAMILALSLGRPVLVPRTKANLAIQEEVGIEWVHTYGSSRPNDESLSKALFATSALSETDEPKLDSRSWDNVKELHYRAYLDAIHAKRENK